MPVAYDLDRAAITLTHDVLCDRPPTLWRYAEVLPVDHPNNLVSLGEGMTCVPALKQLIDQGKIDRDEQIVLFNTGSGLKYLEAFNSQI